MPIFRLLIIGLAAWPAITPIRRLHFKRCLAIGPGRRTATSIAACNTGTPIAKDL